MNILQATGSFLPTKGGCPYFVHYLSQHLEDAGDACRVVTTGRSTQTDAQTVPVDRARSHTLAGFPWSPTYPVVLRRAIADFDPDVVHTHYPLPLYPEVASVLATLNDIPLLLTCHGALEMNWHSTIGAFGSVYNRTLLRGSLAAADRVHVSNDAVLEEIGVLRDARAKVTTIPMGVDTAWFDPDAVDDESPFERTESPTILFVGVFRRYKGIQRLIDAFALVHEHRDCGLVLVGDGPRRSHVESRVASLDLDESVEILGHLDDAELRRAYASAELFVLPSPSIEESYGLVALEAMAMGTPTIVTRGSGIGHVLNESCAGIVVPPADPERMAVAILDVLADNQRYRTEIQAGREMVNKRFAWDLVVDEYRKLYSDMV